jgi:D-threo-aldose 1-dehydrogenase
MSAELPRRTIGTTGVAVTEVAFGGASLGNLYRATTDADADAAVARAWQRGVRTFDTAPHYGLGLSERRLGAALRELPRDEFVLSTKVGRLLVPSPAPAARDTEGFDVPGDLERRWDFTREGVRASLGSSLDRLGLDHVDVVYAHDPEQASPTAAREGLEALAELKREGVVKAIGIGTNAVGDLADLIADGLLDVVMLAGRYTLLEQPGLSTVLDPAAEAGVAVVAVGVFNSGLLAVDRPGDDAKYDYGDAPAALIGRATRIAEVCEAHGTTLPAAAIALPLRHPAVVAVAVGVRDRTQVDQNLDRYAASIPDALWADLVSEGLLDAAVPTSLRKEP